MAFKNWIIVIIFLGWFAGSGRPCDNPPKMAFAIDSSQSISPDDFQHQRNLIAAVVTDFRKPKPGDFAVVLYNTHVHVNITFDQFDSVYNLQNAISSLPFMDPITSGSDLERLFNTTYTKTPEVFLMLKKETNTTYPTGFKVPDGRLSGVKKVAVTFGENSNIRDISDYQTVLQYVDAADFIKYSEHTKIAEKLCYALVSPSTSNAKSSSKTTIHQPVNASPSALTSYASSVSESSLLSSITSFSAKEMLSSVSTEQQTRSPFMTSFLTAFYTSTQLWLNETQDSLSTRGTTSRLTQTPFISMTSSDEKKSEKAVSTITSSEMDSSQGTNHIKIAPCTTVIASVTESRNDYKQGTGDLISKLLNDRRFVLSLNSSHVDIDNKTHIQNYFNKAASLLQYGNFLDHALNLSQQVHYESTSMAVLHALERFTAMVGNAIRRRKTTDFFSSFHAEGLASHIYVVNISTFEGMQIGSTDAENNSVILPKEVFSHVVTNNTDETGLLVSLVFDPFHVLQEPEAFNNFDDNHTVVSKIVNVFTSPPPQRPLSRPVKITVQHSKADGYHAPQCVFWDFTQKGISTKFGKWSKRGCHVFASNARYTECHCDHMTNYAVLMRTTEQVLDATNERILTVITYVGCSVSIVGVFLTIITFLSLPVIKSEITKIHLNLSIAVGVAQVLFLAAGSEKLVETEIICKLYAGLLFYFFMSVFTWMFVEGVHLYQMVVIAFVSRSMMKFYVALGWGLPACAVVITSSIAQDGFGTSNFCWLSPVGGAIWGFVGPAVAVIAINLFVLVQVLRVRVNISKQAGAKVQLRTSARVSLVLLPLLGLSWVFGVFAVNEDTIVFQYLFTISNSIQGLLIFAFHCVGNSEVRLEFQRKASHLNLIRSLTSPSSPATVRVSPIPLQDVNHNRKRDGWVGGKF